MRQCEVYVHDIRAGLLTEEDNGEYIFAYDFPYVADKMPPVSPTMPLREDPPSARPCR